MTKFFGRVGLKKNFYRNRLHDYKNDYSKSRYKTRRCFLDIIDFLLCSSIHPFGANRPCLRGVHFADVIESVQCKEGFECFSEHEVSR